MTVMRQDQQARHQCEYIAAGGRKDQQDADGEQLFIHRSLPLPQVNEQQGQQIEYNHTRQKRHTQHKAVGHIFFEKIEGADDHDQDCRNDRIDGHGIFQRPGFFEQGKAGYHGKNIAGGEKSKQQNPAHAHSPGDGIGLQQLYPQAVQQKNLDQPLRQKSRGQQQGNGMYFTGNKAVAEKSKQKRKD